MAEETFERQLAADDTLIDGTGLRIGGGRVARSGIEHGVTRFERRHIRQNYSKSQLICLALEAETASPRRDAA